MSSIKDPFAKPEPRQPHVSSFRDSSLDLAKGVDVVELDEGDTVPAELLEILKPQETPKR